MKKLLLITFIILCLHQASNAQNNTKIDVVLQQEISLLDTNELIGINIILNQQYIQMDMRMLSNIYSEKETKGISLLVN